MIHTEVKRITLTHCYAVCQACGCLGPAGMAEQHAEDLAILHGWIKADDSDVFTCVTCKGKK